MSEKCRWLGCSKSSVVRVTKESPKIGEFDMPLCHRHARRATGEDYWKAQTVGET